MNRNKLKTLIKLHNQGYVVNDGWANSYASFSVEDDYSKAVINPHYKYRATVTLETSHVVSQEIADHHGVSMVGIVQKQATEAIFQELYGKIVADLVRLSHLVYSGQMDRMETTVYIDNMLKALEQ